MEPSLLHFRSGIRSLGKKKLADGNEHELFYKARTPAEIGDFYAQLGTCDKTEDMVKRVSLLQKAQTKFIAAAMCNEDGSQLMTEEQAALIPLTLKKELCDWIGVGSNTLTDDWGKD